MSEILIVDGLKGLGNGIEDHKQRGRAKMAEHDAVKTLI
jgi:hypothetical protein